MYIFPRPAVGTRRKGSPYELPYASVANLPALGPA